MERDADAPPARLIPDGSLGGDAAGNQFTVVAADRGPAERPAEAEAVPLILLAQNVTGVDRQGEGSAD